jgi:hypothetical protein
MKTLTEIANELGTDKGTEHFRKHSYTLIYEGWFSQLKNKNLNFLEIGIADPRFPGASSKMWQLYFPNGKIFGLDKNEKLKDLDLGNIKIFIGDQSNRKDLEKMVQAFNVEFDIIVDDGAHLARHQQISLGFLFKFLKSGGIYAIEDLRASRYWEPHTFFRKETTYHVLSRFLEKGYIRSRYILPGEEDYFNSNVSDCFIYQVKNMSRWHTLAMLSKK